MQIQLTLSYQLRRSEYFYNWLLVFPRNCGNLILIRCQNMSKWTRGNLTMFQNATPHLMHRAKKLRAKETKAEKAFWQLVRDYRVGGYKFRRQHALAHYVVDFYCHKLQLVIELDGSIHDLCHVREYDLRRQLDIEMMGMKVHRFDNRDVLERPDYVVDQLKQIIAQLEK
jgi:very-short-patch-repair endonuclease